MNEKKNKQYYPKLQINESTQDNWITKMKRIVGPIAIARMMNFYITKNQIKSNQTNKNDFVFW